MSESLSENDYVRLLSDTKLLTLVTVMYNFLFWIVGAGQIFKVVTLLCCWMLLQEPNPVYAPKRPYECLIHIKLHVIVLSYLLSFPPNFYLEHSVVLFNQVPPAYLLIFLQLSNLQTNFTQPLPVCLHGDEDWFSGPEWSKCVLLLH